MSELREAYETPSSPMAISGCAGPRFDGYAPERMMSEDEAQAYHTAQITTFGATDADHIRISISREVVNEYREDILAAYRIVASNMVSIAEMSRGKRTVAPAIRAVATGAPLRMGTPPNVGLIVYGFDADQKLGSGKSTSKRWRKR
jgi:hypothetical protein